MPAREACPSARLRATLRPAHVRARTTPDALRARPLCVCHARHDGTRLRRAPSTRVTGIRAKRVDESHRARLRVEIARLRRVLRMLAGVSATKRGFRLVPRRTRDVVVLARPVEEQHAAVLAFPAHGESWSSSALALSRGASQRTVQPALDTLPSPCNVQSPRREP